MTGTSQVYGESPKDNCNLCRKRQIQMSEPLERKALQPAKTNTKNPLIIGRNDSIISLYANHSARYLQSGGETGMAQVIVRENESLESALKRFKRSCARDGVMAEVRKREHYEKPSVKRKKKSEAARKKAKKY